MSSVSFFKSYEVGDEIFADNDLEVEYLNENNVESSSIMLSVSWNWKQKILILMMPL
jgi:hypothetical protein